MKYKHRDAFHILKIECRKESKLFPCWFFRKVILIKKRKIKKGNVSFDGTKLCSWPFLSNLSLSLEKKIK